MIQAEAVGHILQVLRKKKGLTQEQLSGLATLDRTHYSKIERGLRNPTIDTVFKIASALDMKPHELVKIIEENVDFRF
ncbi:MAG TPA: helix-turn-helix domain-containing protein [Candidatus Intestinimonas pullistercoris]|uniref:Helix-turn-helix domain-containing protein n=1 Tax=Candidatus Intestinimonas pullistercoris TaxID=2838623 RepID=A0A9D2T0V5_9FIRM|nr:helix-turn-helix transcriptional regulator [uncultured Intestinimonas sp.]HJC41040.1 helix-turn-helix domain-containing protein [Candidatus Intestinimonas pullistercoris]